MKQQSTILLKLSGDLFSKGFPGGITKMHAVIDQIAQLSTMTRLGIVIGGGNFFRGSQDKHTYGITQTAADGAGMLATMMNGVMLQNLLAQRGASALFLSAFHVPGIAEIASPHHIESALAEGTIAIFSGGAGVPYLTTDTAAVIRGLQIGASCIWKATKVDGLYDQDPQKNSGARKLSRITHHDALANRLALFDHAAIALAQDHNLPIRFFSMYEDDALLKAFNDPSFGSIITTSH